MLDNYSGIDELVKCASETLTTFGCVCVSRFDQTTALKTAMRIAKRFPNRVFIAEDDEIVHHQLANLSSTQVCVPVVTCCEHYLTKKFFGSFANMNLQLTCMLLNMLHLFYAGKHTATYT